MKRNQNQPKEKLLAEIERLEKIIKISTKKINPKTNPTKK